ncbi:MAG TPA: hypothetical protein VK582_04770 [Pyrinomonadaceae bacterium]|nr:hypothetical protein [Pyrinomonadaceae bacterium]
MSLKEDEETVSYLKTIFDAMDWLQPGILNPIDNSRIHPTPPHGEQWSGYFVNLIVPKDSSSPSLSVHFLQRHQSTLPALKVEMIVSMIREMLHFATDPSAKANSN